jgi:EAL domain-containing protein (putative c-di-GMP-specific phosphodiesterase class I)
VTGRGARNASGAWPDGGVADAPVAHLIDRRGRCRLAFEPVADLVRGEICGYEALPRYPDAMNPARWRREAELRGLEPDLDAFVIGAVLEARKHLPPECCLSFNARPQTLQRRAVRSVLAGIGRLDGLAVEFLPRVPARDEPALLAVVADLRAAGAKVVIDDADRGAATLRLIAVVRPDIVKLDGALVRGCHRDEAKLAAIDAACRFAERLGGQLVAQGVELIEELDTLVDLRVPLAQGPLIGVRAKTLTPIAFALGGYVRERAGRCGGAAGPHPGR